MDLLRLRVEVSGEPDGVVEPSKMPSHRSLDPLTSKLQLLPDSSARVYGRKRELSQLKERYETILHNSEREPELILISGSSGMGKTTLARCLIDTEHAEEATFIQGKFELRQKDPYAPFASAVSMYIENWQSMSADQQLAVDAVRRRAQDAVGDEHSLLSANIPTLALFLENCDRPSIPRDMSLTGPEALQRFRNLFCKLIASICSLQEPMCFFLDDLQWAKQEPLALLGALLTDPSIQGLVIVGACRGDEVSVDDDLAVILRDLEDNSGLKVTQVTLSGLAEEDITDMVAGHLDLEREECVPTGAFFFEKCGGQPFHTLQLLRTLWSSSVISIRDDHVHFDNVAASKLLAEKGEDALNLISDAIRGLPQDCQQWLSTAACLGSKFELAMLDIVLDMPSKECLFIATNGGFVCSDGSKGNGQGYQFVHDIVQQASYGLVAVDNRDRLHFDIAMRLWRGSEVQDRAEELTITVAHHLKNGLRFLVDEDERAEAATLFLLAGTKAKLASSFESAAAYLQSARKLLPLRHWRNHYQLSLAIFTSAAETEQVVGRFDESDWLCRVSIDNGRVLLDKIPAYITQIHSLGCRGRRQEACELGLQVMSLLGEPVPRHTGLLKTFFILRRTSRMLETKSSKGVLALPLMTDPIKLASVQVLSIVMVYAYGQQGSFPAILASKIVTMTLHSGLSAISSVAIACHAAIVSVLFGEVAEAHRYGQLALDLLQAFKVNEYTARVYVMVHGLVNTSRRPMKECLGPMRHAHNAGMLTGDTEFALIALHVYSGVHFLSGAPLGLVLEEALQNRLMMTKFRQDNVLFWHEPFLQATARIAGVDIPPVCIKGVTMDRQEMIGLAEREGDGTQLVINYNTWGIEHFWTGDFKAAMNCFEKCRASGHHNVGFVYRFFPIFFEGIAAFILASQTEAPYFERRRLIRKGTKSLRYLQKYEKEMSENLFHRRCLLEGALARVRGNWELCVSKCKVAAEKAHEFEVLCDEALANELIGRTLMDRSDDVIATDAMEFFQRARTLYGEWGAPFKCEQMDELLGVSA